MRAESLVANARQGKPGVRGDLAARFFIAIFKMQISNFKLLLAPMPRVFLVPALRLGTCISLRSTSVSAKPGLIACADPRRTVGTSNRLRPPAAFTLLEAMLTITIAAIAGSVLLLGLTTSLKTTNDNMYAAIAEGMAQQLMDEIVGLRYCEAGADPYQYPLGPGSDEPSRRYYDDLDDYNGLRSQPPRDFYGIALGTDNGAGGTRNPLFQSSAGFFNNWKQEVDVYYVNANDLKTKLSAGQASDYRMIEVRIIYNDPVEGSQVLAVLNRVVPYVPIMQ
jgi:type II secretory pathway pseudopilin PulG